MNKLIAAGAITLTALAGVLVVAFALRGGDGLGPTAGEVVARAQVARIMRIAQVGPDTTLHLSTIERETPLAPGESPDRKVEMWVPLDSGGIAHTLFSQTTRARGNVESRAAPGAVPNDDTVGKSTAFAAADVRRTFAIWSWQRDAPLDLTPDDAGEPATLTTLHGTPVFVVTYRSPTGGPEPRTQRVYIDARTYQFVRSEDLDADGRVTQSQDTLVFAVEPGDTAPGP
jgi:hypothetical protein